jgi:nucleotide sugar dehydrogenase
VFAIHNSKILIIGLGQIGLNDAEYLSSKGIMADGWDTDEKAVQQAIDQGVISRKAKSFAGYDYYLICVPTHNPDNIVEPSLDELFKIVEKLSREGKTGALIGIESTVMKGTSNKIREILRHRLHVAHFPQRHYVREKEKHGERPIRVLGGCEPCCLNAGLHFYGDMLDIPIHPVSSIEYAELSKIVENAYRFMEIAFAEEIKIVCDEYGLNFEELRKAINSRWNVRLLEVQEGIGGHCLPKDSQMYVDQSKSFLGTSIIDSAKKIDFQYRLHLWHKTT